MNDSKLTRIGLSPLQFVLAGRALFTVLNTKTGNRYTYQVQQPDEQRDPAHPVAFVKVLTGSDNVNDYSMIGMLFDRSNYRHWKRSYIQENAPSEVAFKWFFERLLQGNLPECIQVLHHGKCCRCGRVLTVPESIEAGIGPECATKL